MSHISLVEAVVLGIVQGATEFLPISSSAHLVFLEQLLGVTVKGEALLAFDVSLHFGTLVALVVFFWKDLVSITKGFFSASVSRRVPGRQLGWFIILGTIPAVIFGFGCKKFFDQMFSDAFSSAWQLVITGLILWGTRYVHRRSIAPDAMKAWQAMVIGIAQALAIIPGISRSGTTIATGLFLGLDKDLAARFSFLLSIPALAGATLLTAKDLNAFGGEDLIAVVIGTFVSFVVGLASIKWLMGIIRRGRFSWFAIYCVVVGTAAMGYFYR